MEEEAEEDEVEDEMEPVFFWSKRLFSIPGSPNWKCNGFLMTASGPIWKPQGLILKYF